MTEVHLAHPYGPDPRTGHPRTYCGLCVLPELGPVIGSPVTCCRCLGRLAGFRDWRGASAEVLAKLRADPGRLRRLSIAAELLAGTAGEHVVIRDAAGRLAELAGLGRSLRVVVEVRGADVLAFGPELDAYMARLDPGTWDAARARGDA